MNTVHLKILLALFYDLLIAFGILFFFAFIWIYFGIKSENGISRFAFQIYLLITIYLYYLYFLSKNSSTIGMYIWHLKLVRLPSITNKKINDFAQQGKQYNMPQEKITKLNITLRFILGIFGILTLGLIWIPWGKFGNNINAISIIDKLSNTTIISTKT